MKYILYALTLAAIIYAGADEFFAPTPVYKNYCVTVAQGDTLWDIASRHAEKKEDVRVVMNRIVRANKLDGGHIRPGQIISVPLRVHDEGLLLASK